MVKGKIVLVPFPFSDLSGQKVRPALVLYNSRKEEDGIFAFITSIKQRRIGRFDIPVTESSLNGLKVSSTVKLEKIATLQKKIVLGEIGSLESPILRIVDQKLKELFQI